MTPLSFIAAYPELNIINSDEFYKTKSFIKDLFQVGYMYCIESSIALSISILSLATRQAWADDNQKCNKMFLKKIKIPEFGD